MKATTKSTVWMYVTSGVAGLTLSLLAFDCGVPWYWRYPAYFVMGIVVGIAWKQ